MKDACWLVLWAVLPVSAAWAATPGSWVQLDGRAMADSKARVQSGDPVLAAAWARFQQDAQAALEAPLEDIRAKKHLAPSGNLQDYVSLSTYAWPNPKRPDGMPWIHRDGETNPLTQEYDRLRFNNTVRAVATLGLMGYYQEEGPHAARAVAHLRGWFIDPETRMNPHLRYAQFIPGQNKGSWHGIIEMAVVVESYFFDAVNMLYQRGALDEEGLRAVQRWFGDYLAWLESDPMGRQCLEHNNNITTCMELQRAAIAVFIGRPEQAQDLLRRFGPERIATQIDASGDMRHEMERTKSQGYAAKNLNYLLQVALLARNLGVELANYRSPEGASLRLALENQVAFWVGERSWPGRQIVDYPWVRSLRALRRAGWLWGEEAWHQKVKALQAPDVDALLDDREHLFYPPPR